MSSGALPRRQLRPVILNGAGDVTLPVETKESGHEAGKETPPTFAFEPPVDNQPVSSSSTAAETMDSATSSPTVTSTGALTSASDTSSTATPISTTSLSTASAVSSSAASDNILPSTTVVVVTSSLPSSSSTAIGSSASTPRSDSFYVAIALAATGGVAAILLLLAWWTRVRARSRRRWELASRSSSTTNFDLLWQPSRGRDAGEPKRDFSPPTSLPMPSGAVVRDRAGAFDLVNVPMARARPTLPCELQPSESSLRVLTVCPSPRPEKPLTVDSQRLDDSFKGLGTPREGPGQFKPRYLSIRREAGGLGIRAPSPVPTPSEPPSEKRALPVNNNATWRERLQARRPLPEQPPFDTAFGESWLESLRRRVFVGPDVHVPQNSTDFGPTQNHASSLRTTGPVPTYASHFVTSPTPHSPGSHRIPPHDPPGL